MRRTSLSKICPLRILATGVAVLAAGCAGAKVGDVGQPDSGTADTASYGPCDPIARTGCPSDAKCTALYSGSALAIGCGTKGTKAAGDTCAQIMVGAAQTGDDCGDGLACFQLTADTPATCHQTCSPSGAGTACPTNFACGLDVNGLTTVAFCRASCQVLEQSGCATGQGCYPANVSGVCSTAGPKGPGDSCTQPNDCARGSTCVGTSTGGTCFSFCSTAGGTPSCSSTDRGGTTCNPLTGTSPEPNAGVCSSR